MREHVRAPEPGRAKTWVLKGQNSRKRPPNTILDALVEIKQRVVARVAVVRQDSKAVTQRLF